MPEYLSPGVYVEEIDTGPRPIEGVSTSTAGMVGVTERGPVGVPVLVTSYGAYQRHYGGHLDGSFGDHRLFPHAVEGFFQNGGQRAYIVRALDTDNALHARRDLFDRGEGGGAETVLLRAAGESTGTGANLPLLYVLDAAGAGQGNFVRIGDGSIAEYRQIEADPTDDSHVTLNFPLAHAHDAGAALEQFARATHRDFTLALADPGDEFAAEAGDDDVVLDGAQADLDFLRDNPGELLEIGGPLGEYHFLGAMIRRLSNTQAQFELGGRLAQTYAAGTAAATIDLSGASEATANLDQDANAGDLIVFIDNLADFDNRNHIVVFEAAGAETREARRIGALRILELADRAFDDYPAGTFVDVVQMNNDSYPIANTITLNAAADGFVAGLNLFIDPNGPNEQVEVAAYDPATARVAFTTMFDNQHAVGDTVRLVQTLGPGGAALNDTVIPMDDTRGFADGDNIIVDPGGVGHLNLSTTVVAGSITEDSITIANPLPAILAAGSEVHLERTIAAFGVVGGETMIFLDSVEDMVSGQVVIVGDGGNAEQATVQNVDAATNGVTFVGALANNHNSGDPVQLTITALSADVEAGTQSITLDSRLVLNDDDWLRIGEAPNAEFAQIASIPSQTNVAPDAGLVALTHPLRHDHAAGTPVVRQGDPADNTRAVTVLVNAVTDTITLDSAEGIIGGQTVVVGVPGNEEVRVVDNVQNNQVTFTTNLDVNANHDIGDPVIVSERAYLLHEAAVNSHEFVVTDGNGFTEGSVVLVTLSNGDEFFHTLADDPEEPAPRLVEVTTALGEAHAAASAFFERQSLLTIQALDAGRWGNRLRVSVEDEPTGLVANTTLRAVVDPTHIRLASAAGVEPGTILHFPDPNTGNFQDPNTGDDLGDFVKVNGIDRNDFTLTLAGPLPGNQQVVGRAVRSREFRLTVFLLRHPDPAQPSLDNTVIDSETFRYLSMDHRHSRYVVDVIGAIDGELRQWDRRPEGTSLYIRVRDVAQTNPGTRPPQLDHAVSTSIRLGPEPLRDILPTGQTRPARHPLALGDDAIATIQDDHYIGNDSADPDERTGLHSLRNIDPVSIVAAPGQVSLEIQNALINHCEQDRYRFAVLDGPVPPDDTLTDVQTQRQSFDTLYAALYYPWLFIPEPFPTRLDDIPDLAIPPSGHVIGIYARTDNNRGVHKAPANEVVRGIRGLTRTLSKGEHDILNPSPVNINVIRDFRPDFRSIRVWGARCITSDTNYKYVPVRRLLIFIEESLDEGLQWVVFEPNAEPLWARVRRTISDFLRVVWRNGALEGTSEEQAFFVRCDRTTMTQADIDNGRLICVIGVAPVKPAEFVIIRIGLKTVESES